MLAAGFFLVASIIQPPREKDGKKAPVPRIKSDFVDYVPCVSDQEAKRVNNWLVFAGSAAAIALVLTMATVATVVFFPASPKQVTADVTVTEPYFQQFLAQCQVTAIDPEFRDLVGTLDVASLDSNFVALNIEPGLCADQGELEIPQSAVLQIEEYPQCSSSDLRSIEGTLSSSISGSRSTSELAKPTGMIVFLGSLSATPSPSASVGIPLPRTYPVCGSRAEPFRDFFRKIKSSVGLK